MGIDININIDLSPWQRRIVRVAVVVGAVIGALGVGIAIAAPIDTTWVVMGAPLTAANLKGDLDGLQMQITALVPPGTIQAYGGTIDGNPGDTIDGGAPANPPPTGWLLCNGDQLNGLNATYANLYAAIGLNYGGNTTSQAFNLPDLRGMFLRGADNGAGHDPDVASRAAAATGGHDQGGVGSTQQSVFGAHSHGVPNTLNAGPIYNGGGGLTYFLTGQGQQTTTTVGGNETRPVNTYVNFIIKY